MQHVCGLGPMGGPPAGGRCGGLHDGSREADLSRRTQGARARRNRTRAAITTVVAMMAAAAFGSSAQAAMTVSPGLHPNGFPQWYADTPGNKLGLCVDDPVL